MKIHVRVGLVSLWMAAIPFLAVAQSTDLEAVSLVAPSGSFYAGATILVGYEVRNNGPNAAPGYTVVMHASTDPVIQPSDPETARFDRGPLPAGESYTGLALVTLPFDLPAGTRYLGMRIVYAFDSFSGNNTAFDPDPIVVLAASDLSMWWVSHDVVNVLQGGRKWVRYEVRNLGPGDCPGFPVTFYASNDRFLGTGDRELLTLQQGPLAGGESRTTDVHDVPIPADLPPGRYYIGAAARYAHDPWPHNDVEFGQSDFLVMGAPDLAVLGVSVSPADCRPGDRVDVTVTVQNLGLGASWGHTAVFYLSADSSIGPDDLELSSIDRGVWIEPAATDTFTEGIILPAALGSWYMGVVVTCVSDPFPANNTGRTPLTVARHPVRFTRCVRHGSSNLRIRWTSFAYDGHYRIHASPGPDGPFAPILSPFPPTPPENEAYVGMGTGGRLFLRIVVDP